MSEWQDISTAPRDGSEIILAIMGAGAKVEWVHVGWWEQGDSFPWRFIDTFSLEPTGCCDNESDDRCSVNGAKEESVLFWMPLPEPPSHAMAAIAEKEGA